jgi:hypothetical protein
MRKFKKLYRILDVNLTLESDSKDLLHLFDLDYSWSTAKSTGFERNLDISVMLAPADKKPYVQNGKTRLSLDHYPQQIQFGYYYILRQIMAHIRDYFLLHAGVASKAGRAAIIAGPSGLGKTTLIIELLKKGFHYFSDDICPVYSRTGLIHPFPRSMWKISDPTADIARQGLFIRPLKEPQSAVDLGFPVASAPAPPGSLFFLTDGQPKDNSLRLLVRGNDSIINRLRRLDNIEIMKFENNDCPQWSVTYPRGQELTQKIDAILDEHEDTINFVLRVDPVSPDYTKEPELTKIPTFEMAFWLMQQTQNMKEFTGRDGHAKPGLQMMELCGLFEKVPCYLLKVGRLESMVKLIVKNSGPEGQGFYAGLKNR